MSDLTSLETSAEVRLLGELCKPKELATSAGATLEKLVEQIGDWPRFVELLKHHRVVPLAARNADFMRLARLPGDVGSELRSWSAANAREAFRYVAILQQLLTLLAKEDIAAVVLKGVPLSLSAYDDVSARDVGDIDLLIEARNALRADAILQQSGLSRKEPRATLTPKRASFYLRHFKDFTYEATMGFEVDLHWRLFRDTNAARVLSSGSLEDCSEPFRIGTLDLRVLSKERTLLFLATHGAMEGWARWKTLADIAALWAKANPADRARTWSFAAKASSTGFLAAALVLAEEWFGISFGEVAAAYSEGSTTQDRGLFEYIVRNARLHAQRAAYMTAPAGSSTFAMKLREATLHPSSRSRMELAKRILFRPRIWEVVDLPDSLFALYPFLSPIEWLSFRSGKSSGRSRKP